MNSIPFTTWNDCRRSCFGKSGSGRVLLDKLAVKMKCLPGWQFSMSDSVANFEQDFACEDRVLLAGIYY